MRRFNLSQGLTVEVDEDSVRIFYDRHMRVISSGVLNGGLTNSKAVVNLRVSGAELAGRRPRDVAMERLKGLDLPEDTVCLMTAADTSKAGAYHAEEDGVSVLAVTTAGLSHAAAAGEVVDASSNGTINTIVVINANIPDSCLVGCVVTATEAKARVLRTFGLRSRYSYRIATGTVTDGIAIATTGRGSGQEYCGPATKLGRLVATAVVHSLVEAIERSEGLRLDRGILERLEEARISLDDLVRTAIMLHVPPSRFKSEVELERTLRKRIRRILNDPNVSTLIYAALMLDELGYEGALPSIDRETFEKDPVSLIADEAIGEAIAGYIAGSRGIYNMRYYERHKPGIIGRLGPFLDDAIAALIAGCMTSLYSEEGHEEDS